MARQPHLFLDCDGVLADFDAGAKQLLGMSPAAFESQHGRGEFWKRLARHGNFYGDLKQMPDAQLLFEAVKHLKPTILTGLPLGTWAAPQKERWAAEHFPGVPIITTMAREEASAHGAGRRPGRRPRQPPAALGRRRRHLHPSQECERFDPPARGDLSRQVQSWKPRLRAAVFRSTFSTHSGQNTGSRFDQPGAVAALSLID